MNHRNPNCRNLIVTLVVTALVVLVGCAGAGEPTPTLIPPLPRGVIETVTVDPRMRTIQAELIATALPQLMPIVPTLVP